MDYRILYRDSFAIIPGSWEAPLFPFCSVLTNTPIDLANAAWVTPTPPALSLIAATSMTSGVRTRRVLQRWR
jgi:hypothetical protein